MILYTVCKIAIAIQVLLLVAWAYSLLRPNGTDPAGQGIAIGLLLGMAVYIVGGVMLVRTGKTWAMVVSLIMAAIPIIIVATMLAKEVQFSSRNKDRVESSG